MKRGAPLFALLIIGSVTLLFVASRLVAPGEEEKTPTETPQEEDQMELDPSTTQPPAGWSRYAGDGFRIDMPDTWLVSNQTGFGFTASSGLVDDAYVDPDVVQIVITTSSDPLETLVQEAAWDSTDIAGIIEAMQENALPPFNQLAESDVLSTTETAEIGGIAGFRVKNQCLAPCYLEGGAYTEVVYLLDARETRFVLRAKTGISEESQVLLLSGEEVLGTFQTVKDY